MRIPNFRGLLASAPMHSASRSLALLAALCATATASAQSTFQVYNSEASFLAAAGTAKTETFNAFTSDSAASSVVALQFDDFVVTGDLMVDAPQTQLNIDGSTNLFIVLGRLSGFVDLRFAQPVKAFGAWFNRAPMKINVAADSLSGFGSFTNVGSLEPSTDVPLQFIGFTSEQSFNRIVFEGRGCCVDALAIDNLVYAASLPAVPEPGSWALMAGGLVGLAGWARRRAAASRPA